MAVDVSGVLRVERRTVVFRVAGAVIGVPVALALATGPPNWLGLGAALAAPAFALCLLAGVIVGEVVGAAAVGATRTAAIEVRTAHSVLPIAMVASVAVLTAGLAAMLTTTALVASPDDQGRAGRSLTVACEAFTSSVGPWPGSFYGAPLFGSVLIGLAVAVLALRAVVNRRRPSIGAGARAADDAVRRSSARAIVAACGVIVTASFTGAALFAGGQLRRVGCGSALLPATGAGLLALAAIMAAATCFFTAAAILPYRHSAR